uniref:Uncharacterized protein n=1 Tax=Solanum tuberosum TaxID=4113 RepID=M1DN29_SOLTU
MNVKNEGYRSQGQRGKCQGKGAKPRPKAKAAPSLELLPHLQKWDHRSCSTPRLEKAARGLALAMENWPPFLLATASISREGPQLVVLTTTRGALHEDALGIELRAPKCQGYCLKEHERDHGSWS